jgi:uncharacterized protein (TIGR00369 family)
MNLADALQERIKGLFADLLGIRFIEATPDLIRAELFVRDDLCTIPGLLHGGAIMAFADTLGAVATVLNLPAGHGTTTIESKTNFMAGGKAGTKVTAETTPLHKGKRTMVWQTRVLNADGKLAAVVTQTQMVLEPK